jgi:histidine ammonia-lyase
MQPNHYIHPSPLSISQIAEIIDKKSPLELSEESIAAITNCRSFLENKLATEKVPFYGINTGFGSLCDIRIKDETLHQLQENLVKSHAAGSGDEVPQEVVKIMLLLKIHSLSLGYSGVRLETVQLLKEFYNRDILPVIYQLGSLGASGDLAPLAHLSLPLLGLGEVNYKGKRVPSAEALKDAGLTSTDLAAKEGLALLNGTQFSTGYSVWSLIQARKMAKAALNTAALSLEAFNCHTSPFDERLHVIRPHKGQLDTAQSIRELREGSKIASGEKHSVQDPYAFRCIPQVLGASFDALDHVERVVTTEMNSVTDNPTIFPDSDGILSGGNFHAQPIALVLDYLGMALAEIGSISERRVFQLMMGQRELPAYLTPEPGINSGLMIAQYTAASIVSQNKQLCTPASVDSIVSSNGQEDHVSMAANAATKTYRIVQNLWRLISIEWMCAAQALEFRKPVPTAAKLEKLHQDYRKVVPMLESDRVIHDDMEKTRIWMESTF